MSLEPNAARRGPMSADTLSQATRSPALR